jgi:ornithine--oxo-acid transaminase
MNSHEHIRLTEAYSTHNYSPLEVVISRGEGVWVWDVDGKRYLDMLSAYSALNFGHANPRILQAAHAQLDRLTLTSRAFYNDKLGPLCERLAKLCKLDTVLLMNSGAEAVESSIKIARKWGYEVKGVPDNHAEIICLGQNFAGRTTTIISFSSSPSAKEHFGPFTPGFTIVPFGDAAAMRAAITPHTVAVLVEPIQGEAGIIMPPDGYLSEIAAICRENNVLLIADEIQTGMCRTGKIFACDHEGVIPDIYTIAKSLGGGIVPISAVIGRKEVMDVLTPGTHGSTFGGNPFACAVALEVLNIIEEERPHERAAELGPYLLNALKEIASPIVSGVRGKGLFIGVDIKPEYGPAKKVCHDLMDEGLLCKDTRVQTLRLAPPLVIEKRELDWAIERIAKVLRG